MPMSASCGYSHTSHLYTVGVVSILGFSLSVWLSITCNAHLWCRSSLSVWAKPVRLSSHSVISGFLRRRTRYPQSKRKHQLEWKHAKETCRWRGSEERKEINWAGQQLGYGKGEGTASLVFFHLQCWIFCCINQPHLHSGHLGVSKKRMARAALREI